MDDQFSESEFGGGGGSTYIPPSVSVDDGDYELVCKYSDGAELIITRDDIYITNLSNSINASSTSGIRFFLTSSQKPSRDTDGNVTISNASKLLEDGKQCPHRLYLYKVAATKDENVDKSEAIKDVFNFYYSTKTGIASSIAGTTTTGMWWWKETTSDAKELSDKIVLKSEEINLTTSKAAMICDYQTAGNKFSSQTVSIYIYQGVSFLENGDRITTLKPSFSVCPAKLTDKEIEDDNPNKKYLVVNDPTPRVVGNVLSGNYEYDSIRFVAMQGNKDTLTCTNENGGKPCSVYQYIGTRNGPPEDGQSTDVCELLGNETINILRDVVSWLQILVPALVLILIGIDIAKMVLAGNIEEELPKKKKTILIRLVVMLLFFFAPSIVGLIIKLLNESGIINIGNIECFFR